MRLREPIAAKVPEITITFWLIKLITTYMGEATSDFLGDKLGPGGGVVEVVLMVAAVWWQFSRPRYFAPAYWFLAMVIAISGTGASDTLHNLVHIPFYGTTLLWAVVLAGLLLSWHRCEGTLSIHSITTRRRELFYWCTVFATFALGTALGDLTATTFNLGYAPSGLLFIGIILIPLLGWRLGLNSVVAFWFAYIVTRPLGASFADYVSKPPNISGINFGDGPTAVTALVAIIALVTYVTLAKQGIQAPEREGAPASTSAGSLGAGSSGAGSSGAGSSGAGSSGAGRSVSESQR
jgi:uncharacterized membrane-anchored protein